MISGFKIAVLILVNLYDSDEATNVLPTIEKYLLGKVGLDAQVDSNLKLSLNSLREPYLMEILEDLKPLYSPFGQVSSLFMEKINQWNSIDSLFDCIDSTRNIIINEPVAEHDERPPLHRDSPIGIALRKIIAEFDLLSFQLVNQVFINFRAYCTSLISKTSDESPKNIMSSAELILDHIVDMLERNNLEMPSELLKERLQYISNTMPEFAKTYYVKYLLACKNGEYGLALDNIHRYFDYQKQEKSMYQYALLNLAILHTHFNHIVEAKSILEEAVQVARENQDQECLMYCLSWLQILESNSTALVQDMGIISNLVGKSKNSELAQLESLNELQMARNALDNGASQNTVLKHIHRSNALNEHYNLNIIKGTLIVFCGIVWEYYGRELTEDFGVSKLREMEESSLNMRDIIYGSCALAVHYFNQGKMKESKSLILELQLKQPNVSRELSNLISYYSYLLRFKTALFRGDHINTKILLQQLEVYSKEDFEKYYDYLYLKAIYFERREYFEEAVEVIETTLIELELLNNQTSHTMQIILFKLLLSRIRLFHLDVPIHALQDLIECNVLAEKFHFKKLLIVSKIYLAQAQIIMGSPPKARAFLEDVYAEYEDVNLDKQYEGQMWEIFACLETDQKDHMINLAINAYELMEMSSESNRLKCRK